MQKGRGIFLISLVCIAVILVTGCTSTGSNQVVPAQTAVPTSLVTTTTATFTTTATISSFKEPTTVPTTVMISPNQSQVNNGLIVTLNSAKKKTTTYGGASLPPGIVLLELDITLKNNDKYKDFEYMDSSFVLSFKSNKPSLTAKTTQYAKGVTNPFIGGPVPSGSEKTGTIVFSVNETSNFYTLSVVDSTGKTLTSIDNIDVP